jgi:L-threonylcarbamoyladenylate synthase
MMLCNDQSCSAAILIDGGVIAVPTEGVWGLSCRYDDPHAVQRILQIKARAPSKGLIVLVDDFDALAPFWACDILETARYERGRPSTWVVPVSEQCPRLLTGGRESLAVRQVNMPYLRQLIRYTGPLVSTSANRSGRPAATHRWQVMLELGRDVDYVATARTQGLKKPSMIRDMQTGAVLRA